jgi:hypothetical protein
MEAEIPTEKVEVKTEDKPELKNEPIPNKVEVINKELEDLYIVVSEKISLSVANGEFTVESFELILAKVVETIEELSEAKGFTLTGVEKRNIGTNLVRMVLKDLNKKGQISDSLYSSLNMTLTYVAPLVFYAAKEGYKKINQIADDISENGCSGCYGRNCRSSKKTRGRGRK